MELTRAPDDAAAALYRRVMQELARARIPYLVGGAYALAHYTGIVRSTKDFDIFLRRADLDAALGVLAEAGCRTELAYPHWLAKAYRGDDFVDLIFSSGNAMAAVDDLWFRHAEPATVLGQSILLTPPEEMIWSKAFVMERERFDGADVAHTVHACHERLDWARLVARFGPQWRVLLAHLVLFGFIYPGERSHIPRWVMTELVGRLSAELGTDDGEQVCQGTIISREQYLPDVEAWGYFDARVAPRGPMTREEVERWTKAIGETH